MNVDVTVTGYAVYLAVSVVMTVWVAHALGRHGLVFIQDALAGNEALAAAVNRLLQVGFYLLNLGFVALWLKMSDRPGSVREAFESVAVKIGAVLLVLGVIHLVNVYVLSRVRRRAIAQRGHDELRTYALPEQPPARPQPVPGLRKSSPEGPRPEDVP